MALLSLRWFALGAMLALPIFANSGGAPAGLAGAPGQETCASCHGSGTANPSGGRLSVTVVAGTNYVPGQPLRLRITLEDGTARRWGFQLTARRTSANTQTLGTFTSVSPQTTAPQSTTIGHNSNGTQNGTAGSASWEVQWNPPAADEGPVTFYAAGNAADGNGSANSADKVYTTTLQVAPQGATELTGNRVLPQFVFGTGDAGFISTINFSNTRSTAANVTVSFLTDNGAAMTVGGSSTRTVTLPAKGSAQVRADDSGPFTQGWALLDMPDGVTANGVFRQRVSGRPDQEAAVLLSRANSTEARFSFDESVPGLTTVMAMVNSSSSNATVTIRVYDESGAVLQTLSRPVEARRKVTLVLPSEVAAAEGKRGMVEFEVSGASIAVLALRFQDSGAFTAVPTAE
jgi:hypothetical protein